MTIKKKEELAKNKFSIDKDEKKTQTENNQPKPAWIRVNWFDSEKSVQTKKILKQMKLSTVCQAASCPNRAECFHSGTATFMILGNVCTRRCAFCDVEYGTPAAISTSEPQRIATAVKALNLKYVVITSVTRDDLPDGGALHFARCIKAIREALPEVLIEILTPDFQHCLDQALNIFEGQLPDVFNHNIETIPRLYPEVRPTANFNHSLTLLKQFKLRFPHIPIKSGLMVGLGETKDELIETLKMLRLHLVERLTIGQYLQPTRYHLPVKCYITPEEFTSYATIAKSIGFTQVMSGPLVRSSYHAKDQHLKQQ